MKKNFIYSFLSITAFLLLGKINNTSGQALTRSNFTGIIVPQYMASGSTSLMPVVFRANISGLKKSATYRYYNLMARRQDFGNSSSGSGSVVFMGTSYYTYIVTPNFTTAGYYSTFTTDTSGSYTGWFCVITNPTPANPPRFVAGNYLFPTIALNDGNNGTIVSARYALNDSIKVMAYNAAAGANNITGIYGNSSASARNIVLIYDNINGTGRPLAATYIENKTVVIPNSPAYYSTNVDSKNGSWGSFIPNNNANGVKRLEQWSLSTGTMVGCATDDDGLWPTGNINTINPAGGLTALAISSSDAPLNNCSPVVTVSSSFINTSKVRQGTYNTVLYNLNLYANVLGTRLDTLKINLLGSFISADLKLNGLVLWSSTDGNFDLTDTRLDSISIPSTGINTFDAPINLSVHNTAYLFITANISNTAQVGDSIYAGSTPLSNIILQSGIKTGTNPAPASGAKKIISLTSPMLEATSVNPFGKIIIGKTSPEQSFKLSGQYLAPASGNIAITPPANFQVSFTSGSGYSSGTIIKAYTAGMLASTNIYVIFKPTAYKTYTGNISISGGGSSVTVSVTGTGVKDSIPPIVDTVWATALNIVKVKFNEPVDQVTSENTGNYSGLGTITSAKRSTSLDTVTLTLGTLLTPEVPKTLTINDVTDTSGAVMASPQSFQVQYGKIPLYKIAQVRGIKADGTPDSANVRCKLTGVVQSINFTQNGHRFFIHDGTGGILVLKTGMPVLPYTVNRGDTIRVTGVIGHTTGLLQITPDSITCLDSAHTQRTPVIVRKPDEPKEAEVIKIKNLHLINATQWPTVAGGGRNVQAVYGNDTIVIRIERQCNLQGTPAPAYLFDITGMGSQNDGSSPYTSGYQIMPRDANDLYVHPYPASPLVLNEVLAKSAVGDAWTEIYNPNNVAVFMYKYHLSDDTLNPNKFAFSDTIMIPPLGYLQVFDNTNPTSPGIHANFKPALSNGKIVFTDYNSIISDIIRYTANQHTDTSWARIPNISGPFVLAMPTPGYANRLFPVIIPEYKIYEINKYNPDGEADSLNTICKLTGAVFSINYRAWRPGYQFTLNDYSGGICVFKTDKPFTNYPNINIGDWIRVIGRITQYDGLLEILPDSIVRIDTNHAVSTPLVLSGTISETHESKLIRINDLTLKDTISYPWPKAGDFAMDVKATNGIYDYTIHIETECGLHGNHGYTKPNKKFDIIGIGWQDDATLPYTSGYSIWPRIASDLVITSGMDDNPIASKITIYPVPNDGRFSLVNNYGKVIISIINNLGQVVAGQETGIGTVDFNLNVKQGIYIVRIEDSVTHDLFITKMIIR